MSLYSLDLPTFPRQVVTVFGNATTFAFQSPVVNSECTPTLIKTPRGYMPTFLPGMAPQGQLFSYPLLHQASFEKTLQ